MGRINLDTEVPSKSFTCPHCHKVVEEKTNLYNANRSIKILQCRVCLEEIVYYQDKMVYPSCSTAPFAHKDMPEIIKQDYDEARNILVDSPRGACALLRLAIQKLCDELVEGDQKLFNKIGALVERGLPKQLQQAFDFVRLTGNDAVHGIGELDVQDTPEIAEALFKLINMIVEKMITEPKQVNELYSLIPEGKQKAINERDKKCQ